MQLPYIHPRTHPWRDERDALVRATGGAMLFGAPLLFTMEMWWIGESMARGPLLVFLAGTFVTNVVLAHMSGFRDDDASWLVDVGEACEAMAVGVVVSIAFLLAMSRIDSDSSIGAMVGAVAVQVIPLSLGATVAKLVFAPDVGRSTDGGGAGGSTPLRELGNDVLATSAGATFVGFAIAPTEEIPMLSAALGLVTTLAVVALSLIAAYLIVFASGFDPAHRDRDVGGLFQHPFSETMLSYVISLVCATILLVGFRQVTGDDPLSSALTQVIVLGVPASIGGAAGRVVV